MALSIPERIAQVAEHFAEDDDHGYSQPNRGTGGYEAVTLSDGSTVTVTGSDVDCSEMVRQCVNAAISGHCDAPITYMWTGSEDDELTAIGFDRIGFDPSIVRRGDALWVKGHTGIALGGGMQADAHGDEYGGISGPNRGDQTGSEVEVRDLRGSWTYIYRYAGGDSAPSSTTPIAGTYRIVVTDVTNVRAAPSLDAEVTGQLDPGDEIVCDGWLAAEGRTWATYVANSGKRRYVSLGAKNAWVEVG